VVLGELLIELGAGRFLLDFVSASFYLIDALPKPFLIDLKVINLFLQFPTLLPQFPQSQIHLFLFLLKHQNFFLKGVVRFSDIAGVGWPFLVLLQ
jgi:hypothetical protein